MTIAEKHNLKVIEDCAHAPFGWYQFKNGIRKFVGAIGDIGCFSFFGNKNMTTGEGGMITTDNPDLAEKIRLLRSHGMTTLTYERHKGHATGYDAIILGYNYRIDEIRSAIGLCQLKKIDRLNDARRQVFKWYKETLTGNKNVIIPFMDRDVEQSTCHIMPIILKERYQEIKQRFKDAGIQTSKHYDLIPEFTAFGKKQFDSKVNYFHNILTLPMYHRLNIKDIEYIDTVLK
jgi:dTDP-4-amino-4,6-dideoxygalactose transaminase